MQIKIYFSVGKMQKIGYNKVGKMQEVIHVLKRKVYSTLKNWFDSNSKKGLLLTGARQIGKTYIIREFLKQNSKNYVEFNLFENDLAKEAFESSKTADDFLLKLSSLTKKTLIKNKTIIFIDEVQFAKEIVTKIKFLIEEGSYKYIFSGSLLGVELKHINSIPVGYMDIVEMYPMDFEEFAIANNVSERILSYIKECYLNKKEVEPIIHEQMLRLFNLYVVIGGFPEAVVQYINTNNIQKVNDVHETIDKGYRMDISKYDQEHSLLIKDIYDLIPSELNHTNKRFILKNLNEKARFYQYEESFVWLIDSNVGLFTYNIDNPVYPLLASKERTLFKLFLCDVGLLTYKLFGDSAIKLLNNNKDVNYGALYEAVIAQELKAKNIPLYYYNNKKNGEVDFIIENNDSIIPIEVKSGKDYKRHIALDNLLSNDGYNIKEGYTLSNGNLQVNGKRIYLPIYMIMFFGFKEKNKDNIYKIDISSLTNK